MPRPTPFLDLNDLLADFAGGVQAVLDRNFAGTYLQGSFAVGDADEHSDVDFLVVTRSVPSAAEVAALQALHQGLYARAVPWAQHLEGSYAPAAALRTLAAAGEPWWYLDNGATTLALDPHCNTAVVRWSLREHGVVLAGPPPASLVDPVPADALRAEVRVAAAELAAWAPESQQRFERGDGRPGMSRWKQPYVVLSFCRMLHTTASGVVTSKKVAGEWALGVVGPRWVPLVRRALDDRPDPWGRVPQPADADVIDETLAFAGWALAEVRSGPAPAGP